jgi:drug/metabolite transporter (DMT)-like permease
VIDGGHRGRDWVGAVFVLLAALLFGLVIVMARVLAMSSFPVSTILVTRFGVGSALLAGIARFLRQELRPARRELPWLVVMGFLGYTAAVHFMFSALRYGTAPAVTFLGFTYPVFVALLWIAVTRSFPSPLINASLVLAASGVALVAASGGELSIEPLGTALAIGSAVATAGYLVLAAHKLRATPPLTSAFWMSASAALALLIITVASRDFAAPDNTEHLWLLLGITVCGTGALVFLLVGLPRIGPVRTSVIAAMEPLSVVLFSVFLLDEHLTPTATLGGVLILVGATCATAAKPKEARPRLPAGDFPSGM